MTTVWTALVFASLNWQLDIETDKMMRLDFDQRRRTQTTLVSNCHEQGG